MFPKIFASLAAICLVAGTVVLPAQTIVPERGVSETSGTSLTWEASVRLATAHNPDLQAAREGVLNSDAVHRGAYSQLYPQIALAFSSTAAYAGPNLPAPSDYASAYSEQLTVTQTIFNGFATKGNIDQSRAQLALAFANLNATKAAVSYNLKAAFAQLLYAQQLIVVSRNVVDIQRRTARLVKLLYEGGSEDKGAMLLSQANLDQALFGLAQAQRTYDLSGIQLGVTIGQDLPAPVQALGDLMTRPLSVSPDFRKLAVQTPTYFQHRAQADAASAGITLADSGWYPNITADFNVGRADSVFLPRVNDFSGGVGVSYPIFEGGQTYFNVKAATATFRQTLAQLQSGTNQAALALAQAFKNLVDDEENVRIQNELLEATALRYKIAEASYRNGLESFQDFVTITDSYVSQQQNLLSSRLAAVIAEANWEQARGLGAIP